MDIRISGRHMEITEAMETHIRQRIDKLPRLDGQVSAVAVTLSKDSGGEQVEIVAKSHKNVLVTNARGHNLYAGVDEAFEKLERRIAKLHDKLVDRHAREAQKASRQKREP